MNHLYILLAFTVLFAQGSDISIDEESVHGHGHGHGAVHIPVVAAAAPQFYHDGWGFGWGWGPWNKKARKSHKRRKTNKI
ncbi:hypothetical protein Y032_0295g1659 [Ancylostoma ceylanicum]|uniref:Uncharacterized protein n=1 Tax=Ancylostoma ceylanicum TaxID=53326 RepID=A0A016S4M4_9BILA|nr:hypothetical protein Y032_0295g1659 [Ancylostoma ceylanicum]